MLYKYYWIVLYTVHVTAFCLGGPFFSGHGVVQTTLLELILHVYPRAYLKNIFVVTRDEQRCLKRTVIRRIFGIRGRTADLRIFRRRKVAGSYTCTSSEP